MEFGNGIMCIINLLFIPIIALRCHCNRSKVKFEFSSDCVYMYTLICVLNVPAAAFFVSLLEKFFSATYQITTGGQLGAVMPVITLFTQLGQGTFSCPVYSIAYTVVALLSSWLLVLFLEILKKTISLEVSVEKRKTGKRKEAAAADRGEDTADEN